jgi:hypothetical protein
MVSRCSLPLPVRGFHRINIDRFDVRGGCSCSDGGFLFVVMNWQCLTLLAILRRLHRLLRSWPAHGFMHGRGRQVKKMMLHLWTLWEHRPFSRLGLGPRTKHDRARCHSVIEDGHVGIPRTSAVRPTPKDNRCHVRCFGVLLRLDESSELSKHRRPGDLRLECTKECAFLCSRSFHLEHHPNRGSASILCKPHSRARLCTKMAWRTGG